MIHSGKALVAAGLVAALGLAGPAFADGTSVPVPDDGANIVNGIPTNLQPTTGALLFVGPDLKNEFLDCSGVLIGCRTVLTAAHCICKTTDNYADCVNKDVPALDTADLRFFFQHSGLHHVREVYINPTYDRGTQGDLALLRLSEKVEGIEPAVIHKGFPSVIPRGTAGVIAGFGNTGEDKLDAAIKRVGDVTTAACPSSTGVYEPANICWNFEAPIDKPGDEASLCLKDDGGPLFADFGNGPEVTGISGGGGPTCDVDTYAYATNVARSKDWIATVGGLDVTRDQCSDFGEVGEPWVKVQGGRGRLLKNEQEMSFSFLVPKDSLRVRVTINGDTERTGDYDLFVGLDGKVPTRFDNDCESRGVGQFGVCSFEEPGAQRVNVLVRHVRPKIGTGKSRFQVTVTSWEVKPPDGDPPRGPDMLRYEKRAPGFRNMTWFDDSNNEDGFEIQRRPGTDPAASFVTRGTSKADKGNFLDAVPDDQVFTYRVRAFNVHGSSEWSNLCVVNKPRLARPTRLRATAVAPGSVALRWGDNSDGESYFELQRRISGATKWKTIKLVSADDTTTIDNGVDPGQNYEYHIRARGYLDQCIGHSAYSPLLAVTTPVQ